MVIEMTPQELRDYIRFMPDDEVLKITIHIHQVRTCDVKLHQQRTRRRSKGQSGNWPVSSGQLPVHKRRSVTA